ncbi:MAG TPA: hypothetical protein VHU81_20980 [Thermoanaerobaculia bacterium]|nr:hypothetical protein [Thermoanaerobaculia bacterium]
MKIHPHELLLEELLESLSDDQRKVLGHALQCEPCRQKAAELLRPQRLQLLRKVGKLLCWPGRARQVDYGPVLERSSRFFRCRQAAYEKERAEAEPLIAELLALPAGRRRLCVLNRSRFHTWGLLERLVESSREKSFQDPREAEGIAELALEVAAVLDADYYGVQRIEDLRARAWGYAGNARRIHGDLAAAGQAFERAFDHLKLGTREPIERAILLDLRASLLRAERRFPEAMELLEEALAILLIAGDPHRAGRVLVNMDNIHHHAGTPEQGIPLLYRALELIDPQQEPRLALCAWHNLVDDLAEAGCFMEAQKILRRAIPIYRQIPEPWSEHRRQWVEGKIARGLGQESRAEALLGAARDGFLAQDLPYDVALVSLELAALYAGQGRTAEVRRIAAEMLPLFSARGIHREALAALAFWRRAVESEQGGLALTSELLAFCKRARFDPELRFEARNGGRAVDAIEAEPAS